jgi:hypothetical protein
LTCAFFVDVEPKPRAEAKSTQHFDLPANGTIRVAHSIGALDIEAWDGSGVEVSVVRTAKPGDTAALDRVHFTMERKGDDLDISAEYPKHHVVERPFKGVTDFDLEIHIKAPPGAKLSIDQESGEINIDGMTGDIHVVNGYGDIALHLPDGNYAIDARVTSVGAVTSDFAGTARSKHRLGEDFERKNSPPAANLDLRLGRGDIIIVKQRRPAPPAPLAR